MWVRDIPIPVERIDSPVLRLFDSARVAAAMSVQQLYEGFLVTGHLYEAFRLIGSSAPFLGVVVQPRKLTLSPDGTALHLQVEAELYLRVQAKRGLEQAFQAGLDVQRGLAPDEAAERLAHALAWTAGEKVLVPLPSGIAGISGFEAYLCDRFRPAGSMKVASTRLFAGTPPDELLSIQFASVRPEGQEPARRWAQVLHGGSLLPVAAELGLDVQRCLEGGGRGAVSWLSVGIYIAGLAGDRTAVLRLHVAEAPSVRPETVRRLADPEGGADGWAALRQEVLAAIDVARNWPAPVRLSRVPQDGRLLTCAVRLQEHPHAPGAARRLAEAAMSALLRGMPLDGVRQRLQDLWDDPRSLRALETLAIF